MDYRGGQTFPVWIGDEGCKTGVIDANKRVGCAKVNSNDHKDFGVVEQQQNALMDSIRREWRGTLRRHSDAKLKTGMKKDSMGLHASFRLGSQVGENISRGHICNGWQGEWKK
jgi:hypothetical protein